ncbi:MAG: hypothetical protein DRP64_15040, partial [Verrucomicrobia bacterium]
MKRKTRILDFCSLIALIVVATGSTALADDHGDTWQTATGIAVDSDINGEINPNSDIDYFRVPLIAGYSYDIHVDLGTLSDTRLWLFDADGTTQLDYNDDDPQGGLDSRITFNCPATDDYYLKVDSYNNGSSGTYILRVSDTSPGVYLEPYETPTQELFFKDFNGDGRADMAVRTSGATSVVDVYFQSFHDPQPRLVNGDFETGDLTGWTKTGGAFDLNPTQSDGGGLFSGWEGNWYVNSWVAGESETGTLTSDPFALTSQYISFLITGWSAWGGGAEEYNYVTLHLASDDSVLDRIYTPNQTAGMLTKMLNGGTNVGQQVYIKVTDDGGAAGFAWMAVDSFRIGGQSARYIFNADADMSSTGVAVNNTTDWGLFFADTTGDGKADLINHNRTTGDVFVHYNLGSGFSPTANKIYSALAPVGGNHRIFFADINADGFDDYCILNMETGYFEAFRNISGNLEPTAYIQQTIGTVSYPFNGNESLLAVITGDGKADFVNFNQTAMTFTCHENMGTGFDAVGKSFKGFPERYEHQYFLEDFDADGSADFVQLALRRGDMVVHDIFQTQTDGFDIDADAFFRHIGAPGFTLPSEGRDIINAENHSVNGMMLYEIDNLSWANRPDNGWFYLNPNHPGIVPGPGQPPYTGDEHWRTATPLLGLYDNRDPEVIKQHAYWMRAMGVDVVLLDWTNLTSTKQPSSHVYEFTLRVHDATRAILDVYSTITEFVPPKIVVAMRMQEEFAPFTITQEIADDAWEIYAPYPELMFTSHDGTSGSDKSMLVAFAGFEDAAWTSTGPVWGDSRFNMRYMNGYLMNRPGMTVAESTDWKRIADDDWPYWPFVESDPTGGGYYRNLYRRLPGTSIPELAMTWVALHNGGLTWDGQLDVVDGKYLIQRYSEPLYNKVPRITFMNRWCYPSGWYNEPQEGLSLNYSTIIEPSLDLGFENFDRAADIMYDLRGLIKHVPGKPVIKSVVDGRYVAFTSSNLPVQYKVSDDKDGIGEDWEYIDVNHPVIELPVSLQNKPFYLR